MFSASRIFTGDRISGTIERPYIMLETGVAWCRNIPIVPLLQNYSKKDFVSDESIPLIIRTKQAVELSNRGEFKRLLTLLKEQVELSRKNQRRVNRKPLNFPVNIVCENDGSCHMATIVEFSQDGGGCFINTEKTFNDHDTIKTTFSADVIHNRPRELDKNIIPGIGVKIHKKP